MFLAYTRELKNIAIFSFRKHFSRKHQLGSMIPFNYSDERKSVLNHSCWLQISKVNGNGPKINLDINIYFFWARASNLSLNVIDISPTKNSQIFSNGGLFRCDPTISIEIKFRGNYIPLKFDKFDLYKKSFVISE